MKAGRAFRHRKDDPPFSLHSPFRKQAPAPCRGGWLRSFAPEPGADRFPGNAGAPGEIVTQRTPAFIGQPRPRRSSRARRPLVGVSGPRGKRILWTRRGISDSMIMRDEDDDSSRNSKRGRYPDKAPFPTTGQARRGLPTSPLRAHRGKFDANCSGHAFRDRGTDLPRHRARQIGVKLPTMIEGSVYPLKPAQGEPPRQAG